MVQKYLQCDSKVIQGTRFHINLNKRLVNIKKRVMMAWGFFVALGVSYVAQPLLTPGRHFAEDLYVVYGELGYFLGNEISYQYFKIFSFLNIYSMSFV